MADAIARGILQHNNLTVSVGLFGATAREGARRHGMSDAAASLFAHGVAGAALMASLQKSETRINLQLECDGPVRGFFVDAGTNGQVRGYVKNPSFDIELSQGAFQWRAALGNSGFLSVLRDIGGEYYRSSVELTEFDVSGDLNHYFATSDQTPTRVALVVRPGQGLHVGLAAGVLIQTLPQGDEAALARLGQGLGERLAKELTAQPTHSASSLMTALFAQAEALGERPVHYGCSCSHERAMNTLASLGAAEVQDIVDTTGSTAVTCHFCGAKHEISLQNLWDILERLGKPYPRS